MKSKGASEYTVFVIAVVAGVLSMLFNSPIPFVLAVLIIVVDTACPLFLMMFMDKKFFHRIGKQKIALEEDTHKQILLVKYLKRVRYNRENKIKCPRSTYYGFKLIDRIPKVILDHSSFIGVLNQTLTIERELVNELEGKTVEELLTSNNEFVREMGLRLAREQI